MLFAMDTENVANQLRRITSILECYPKNIKMHLLSAEKDITK